MFNKRERLVKHHRDGTSDVWRTCSVTAKPYSVTVKSVDLDAWQTGKMAQDAFPYLDADQREFLISNTTPAEWNRFFGYMEK